MIDQNIFQERNFHGAKGIVFINHKMLVYRRDTKTDNFPLRIDLPGGGKENNESPFETFKREIQEEFGINLDKEDIIYAKKYISALDPTKESYFLVTKPLQVEAKDIVFGDEGVEFMLIDLPEYLKLSDAIKRQQDRVMDYLNTINI